MWWKIVQNLLIFVYFFVKEAAKLILENLPYLRNDNAVYKAILKPVYWFGIPNSGSETLKSVKVKLSKNRQITVHALVPQSALSVLFCFPYTRFQLASHKHCFFQFRFSFVVQAAMFLTNPSLHHYVYTQSINIILVRNISTNNSLEKLICMKRGVNILKLFILLTTGIFYNIACSALRACIYSKYKIEQKSSRLTANVALRH